MNTHQGADEDGNEIISWFLRLGERQAFIELEREEEMLETTKMARRREEVDEIGIL